MSARYWLISAHRTATIAAVVVLLVACNAGAAAPSGTATLTSDAPSPSTGASLTPSTPATHSPTPTPTARASGASWTPATATDPAVMDARYRAALPLFEYDKAAPLALRTIETTERGDLSVDEITFASPSGATAHGLVVARPSAAGLPALVMTFPGHARDLLDRAENLARLGVLVVVIDPPQVRRGGPFMTFTSADREEQVELLLQLRRAVDVALELGADPNRIAYWGYSWGGAMGVALAGIEHRIGSFVVMYGEGSAVEHYTYAHGGGELAAVPKDQREAWIDAMEPIEPVYFVGHAAPSALFFQNGTRDESVLPEAAMRLHAVASEPKEVRWYETGHEDAPPEVWCDQAKWLKDQLELTSSDVPEC